MMRADLATEQPFERDEYRKFRAVGHVVASRGEQHFPLVVGYDDVRRVARDWQRFTSDTPFEVPIPHEHDVRSVRQIPIELDPPAHRAFRALVEPRFSRNAIESHSPVVAQVVKPVLDAAIDRGRLDVARDLALPVVNHALAAVLGLPVEDVLTWLEWGAHVFNTTDDGSQTPNTRLDEYLDRVVDSALDGHDVGMFSELAAASVDGRPLTRDELLGFGNLLFAGGRDTVVAGIVNAFLTIAHIPAALDWLRDDELNVQSAVEEILRIQSPLGYIGRHTTEPVLLDDRSLPAGTLIGLGFAAANRDPAVFEDADRCRLDRQPNRHVAFGHGPHTCLGAQLARMEMRVTLQCLADTAARIEVVEEPRRRYQSIAGQSVLAGFDEVCVRVTCR